MSKKIVVTLPDETYKLMKNLNGMGDKDAEIVRNLVMLESGMNDPESSPPVLLFTGPSGSGKTHLVKVVAEEWLGKTNEHGMSPFVKISGENYSESH